MKVIVDLQQIEYENTYEGVVQAFKYIDEKSNGRLLKHLIIDGVAIYNNFINYLIENKKGIKEVRVDYYAQNKDLIDESLREMNRYLNAVLDPLKELVNSLYDTSTTKVWTRLGEVVEGVNYVLVVISSLEGEDNQYVVELKEVLGSIESAIFANDEIQIAETLEYELIPIYNKITMRYNVNA